MYTRHSPRAMKYKIPDHIEMNTSYGKCGHNGLVIWTKKYKKIIGYPISMVGLENLAKRLKISTSFNIVGQAKITDHLLSWSKKQWDEFHLMDVIAGGRPDIPVYIMTRVRQTDPDRHVWTHVKIELGEDIFILPKEDRYID